MPQVIVDVSDAVLFEVFLRERFGDGPVLVANVGLGPADEVGDPELLAASFVGPLKGGERGSPFWYYQQFQRFPLFRDFVLEAAKKAEEEARGVQPDMRALLDDAWHKVGLAYPVQDRKDPVFWVEVLAKQLHEAEVHHALGDLGKFYAEVADVVAVAWSCLRAGGHVPADFIAARVRERILPRAAEVVAKYSRQGRNGA